jgi:hypothetical protein
MRKSSGDTIGRMLPRAISCGRRYRAARFHLWPAAKLVHTRTLTYAANYT